MGLYIALALAMAIAVLGFAAKRIPSSPCSNTPSAPMKSATKVGTCSVQGIDAKGEAAMLQCELATDRFKVSLWKRMEESK